MESLPSVTMDDIARELGVAKSTVSKAMNGAADVSEATKKMVLEKAVELGYSRVIRTGSDKRLCVFVENMAYEQPEDFGWEIITGLKKAAELVGYQVDVVRLSEDMERKERYDSFMLRNSYSGALFLGLTYLDPWMKEFETCRTPTVLYDNQIKGNAFVTSLGVDNEEGMECAISALKELGHSKIGYLSGELGCYIYQTRYDAYFYAMRVQGLETEADLAGHSFFTSECLNHHLPRLLDKGCTAIICSNDVLAYSVIIHCREQGIRIPEDLSIVGFDDIPLCRFTIPPLSSVRQNRTELGRCAFYALESQLNDSHISKLSLHAELVQRQSMGRCPS